MHGQVRRGGMLHVQYHVCYVMSHSLYSPPDFSIHLMRCVRQHSPLGTLSCACSYLNCTLMTSCHSHNELYFSYTLEAEYTCAVYRVSLE